MAVWRATILFSLRMRTQSRKIAFRAWQAVALSALLPSDLCHAAGDGS